MEKILQKMTMLGCMVGGLLFGEPDALLYALLAMMALDYCSGLLRGIAQHRLSSSIGFRGICRKLLILVLVIVGHLIDCLVLGGSDTVRTTVEGFYLANEGISILENVGSLGIPLPACLRRVLIQIRDEDIEEEDENE